MRDGATRGGEGVVDGVAVGGGCAVVFFEPWGAGACEHPEEVQCGDGESDAGRDREHICHASVRCVHHPTETESDAKTGECTPARRERHDGWSAGSAQVGPDGTIHWEGLAFATSAVSGECTESGGMGRCPRGHEEAGDRGGPSVGERQEPDRGGFGAPPSRPKPPGSIHTGCTNERRERNDAKLRPCGRLREVRTEPGMRIAAPT